MKGRFVGVFDALPIDGRLWKLQNPNNEWGFILDDGRATVPPDGFLFNFASVPRPFWPIFPPVGDGPRKNYGPAAAVHDWLYEYKKINGKPISRREADMIFLAAMTALNVRATTKYPIYLAVRLFAGFAWRAK